MNLDNNELYSVPQLRLIGTSRLRPDNERGTPIIATRSSTTPGGRSAISGARGASNRKLSGEISEQQQGKSGDNELVEEKVPATEERCGDGGSGEVCEDGGGGEGRRESVGLQVETERPASVSRLPPSMAPFPRLLTLSLANNLVSQLTCY